MDSEKSSIFNSTEQEKPRSSRVSQALIITAATFIILTGIKFASGLVGPMLLALFIAIILLVPLRWLQERGYPNFLAYPIVLFFTIALFGGVTYFVGQTLNDEIRKIPVYRDQFVEKYAALEAQFEQYIGRLGFVINKVDTEDQPENGEPSEEPGEAAELVSPEPVVPEPPPVEQSDKRDDNVVEPTALSDDEALDDEALIGDFLFQEAVVSESEPTGEADEEGTEEGADENEDTGEEILAEAFFSIPEVRAWVDEMERKDPLPTALEPSVVAFWIARTMLYLQGILGGAFLVLLFTIFMLFEAVHFPKKVNRAFGTDGPLNIGHLHHIAVEIRRYLFLKTLSNLMSGSAAMFVYWMFGVPGALFWGIVAFFMYYIPNLGGTLAAVIPGILIFMMADIYTVLLYAFCLLTVECAIAYGIEPKLLGHGLRLSTLVIILSLFFWHFLLGPIGLFLAAPLTVMTKIILQAFPETRWCAIFLDGGRE